MKALSAYRLINIRGSLLLLLICTVLWGAAGSVQAQDTLETPRVSLSDFSPEDGTSYISDVWKFQSGDDSRWANPALVDTAWQEVSTYLGPSELPFIEWNGIGWFRLHLKVDSSLVNYPLALFVQQHNGASEIFWKGEKISQIGAVSMSRNTYQAERSFKPVPIVFSDTTEHVLAVRYANHDAAYFNSFNSIGFTAGFRFLLADLNFQSAEDGSKVPEHGGLPIFFIGSLLAFTIIHMLLYLFYPTGKRNLYFAFFVGVLALLIYALYITGATGAPIKALFYYRFSLIGWLLAVMFALRFTYSLIYDRTPVQFWVFCVIAVILGLFSWMDGGLTILFREVFVIVTLLEILRVLLFAFPKKTGGNWIIIAGIFCFIIGIFYKVLIDFGVVAGDPVEGSIYGSGALIFSMSIFLSRDFAKTNRQLEQKLLEVKHLSERSLRQERLNRERELQQKLLSAENERKSLELEEARALQLSMLPKKIPGTDHWDIAVFMETAYEVGGDYYDFSNSGEDNLTIAIGDATGHGMKAGIMVAAAKSYFHTLTDRSDSLDVIDQMSTGIRNMDLKTMFMGFQMLKCNKRNVTIVSAGMPPVLWYRSGRNEVEELILKGLPLGTRAQYPYKDLNISVEAGDVLLLMSDGLQEAFNRNRRQLGLDRIKDTLHEAGDYAAPDILSHITRLMDQWLDGESQDDNITVMVMKAKD